MINELIAIEMRMVEVRDLFADIAERMKERSIGILGFSVTQSQLKAMTALAEDSLISMSSLCTMAKLKMPSLTEVVDRFESEGILTRIRDDGDRRVVRVSLTEKGKKVHREVLKKRAEVLKGLFGTLEKKERAALVDALTTVATVLNKIVASTANQDRAYHPINHRKGMGTTEYTENTEGGIREVFFFRGFRVFCGVPYTSPHPK